MQVFAKRTDSVGGSRYRLLIATEGRQSTGRLSTLSYSKDDYVNCKLNLHGDDLEHSRGRTDPKAR